MEKAYARKITAAIEAEFGERAARHQCYCGYWTPRGISPVRARALLYAHLVSRH